MGRIGRSGGDGEYPNEIGCVGARFGNAEIVWVFLGNHLRVLGPVDEAIAIIDLGRSRQGAVVTISKVSAACHRAACACIDGDGVCMIYIEMRHILAWFINSDGKRIIRHVPTCIADFGPVEERLGRSGRQGDVITTEEITIV